MYGALPDTYALPENIPHGVWQPHGHLDLIIALFFASFPWKLPKVKEKTKNVNNFLNICARITKSTSN